MIPLIKHPGGKKTEIKFFKEFYPKNINTFIEPFFGGGAVFFELEHSKNIINDLDTYLINFYKYIKNQDKSFFYFLKLFQELRLFSSKVKDVKSIEKHNIKLPKEFQELEFFFEKYFNKNIEYIKKNKKVLKVEIISYIQKSYFEALYYFSRDIYNKSLDKQKEHLTPFDIVCYIYVKEFAYTGMVRFNNSGKFNVPYGGISYNNKDLGKKINYFQSNELIKLFSNTNIFNLDFYDFFNSITLKDDDFIFLDPPYDTKFSKYTSEEDFNKDKQIELRDNLNNLKCKWMIVIKHTDFIYDLYKKFNIIKFDKKYALNFKNRNKDTKVIHLIITNY